MSELANDLNLLQVIAKDRIESTGSLSKIENRWSCAKLAIGEVDPLLMLLVLLLDSAMSVMAC